MAECAMFINRVGFIRTVMRLAADGLGPGEGQVILEKIVDPGLEILRRDVRSGFGDLAEWQCLDNERSDLSPIRIKWLDCMPTRYNSRTNEILKQGVNIHTCVIGDDEMPDTDNSLAKHVLNECAALSSIELGRGIGHQYYLLILVALDVLEQFLRVGSEEQYPRELAEARELKAALRRVADELLRGHYEYAFGAFDCDENCYGCPHFSGKE